MERNDRCDFASANDNLVREFIEIYQLGNISPVYNLRQRAKYGNKSVVFFEQDGNYHIVTYTVLLPQKEYAKDLRKYKSKIEKQNRNHTYLYNK